MRNSRKHFIDIPLGYNPDMEPPVIEQKSANKQIAKASSTIMFAFIVGQAISLLAGILIAKRWGTGLEIDAFNAANKFPDILYQLIAGGALASAFVPAFATLLTNGERSKGWRLASSVATLITMILLILGTLTAIFAPWVVRYILAPGFVDPVKFQLTVDLMRVQLIAPVFFGVSGLIMGILNSHQSFLWPALAPAMYSIGKIIGVVFLAPSLGIHGLAIGVVVGAFLHGLVQLLPLLKLPERKFTLSLGLKMKEVREVARLMGPRLLGVAFVQVNFLVNYRLASGLGDGPITAIQTGLTLMLIPEIAIAQSIGIAAMPTFSALVAQGKLAEMRSSLASLLRGLFFLAVPASLGMMILRVPLVSLIYERNAFDANSTKLVAWALLFYAAGLVGFSVVEVVSRAFYALHDTKTPVFVLVATMSLNVVLSILFLNVFSHYGWMPHGGLALSMSLATFVEMGALLYFMRRKLSGLEGRKTLSGLLQSFIAGGVMSLVLWGWLIVASRLQVWIVALGGVFLGGITYIVMLAIIKVPEFRMLLQIIMRRFRPDTQKGKGSL
jgi:putative peptidoglycan lipid II flippase